MLEIKFIYNINRTTLPMDRNTLSDCISLTPTVGYIYCPYEELISKTNEINSAKEISVTKNPSEIFDKTNSIETATDIVFKVEGMKKNSDVFVDSVLSSNDMDTWTDFSTYSKEFRSDILRMKELCFKKFLWNYENIHSWFQGSNIQLDFSAESRLSSDWELFKKDVIETDDLDDFIGACGEVEKQSFISALIRNAKKILARHKVELMLHVYANDKSEKEIILENPIIAKIFIVSSKYSQCKKDFPSLRVTSISPRNFNMIGILA